ncbi:MAG: DUF5103 domain-containing protein [Saprospiraceae bacterium]
MNKYLFVLLFSITPLYTLLAIQVPVLYDTIYSPDIASLKCHVSGLPMSMPVFEIGSGSGISIYFDDLRSGSHRYKYELIHMDKNWHKDELDEIDYIDGFNRSEIRDYAYSTNRNADFTFYKFYLPNNDIRLTKSGNYIMHVYEELKRGQPEYIFTRRIFVVDPKVKINALFARPTDALKYRTNQEIDLEVSNKGFPIYNSREEVTCAVMQNGRWSTLISNLKQNRDKTEALVFDYIDKVSFPAGKEFRIFDTRTLLIRSRFVKKITDTKDDIIVTLYNDKLRSLTNFVSEQDANGNYIIANSDYPDENRSAEYTWVDFTLESPEFEKYKVYIIGALSDWQCKEPLLMKYDKVTNTYLGSAFLKQGYYNYTYVIQDAFGQTSSSPIDGDWYETENDYQIMVYYRPFGSRYDQLIAFQTAKP